MTRQPNILFLHAHDAGRWVSPYGYAVKTPNIKQFAEDGVLFRKAFCAAPTCGPSRAAIFSGQYPHQVGMYGLPGDSRDWRFDDYSKHLVNQLKDLGYQTALAGCEHEIPKAEIATLGYQEILKLPHRKNGECYAETITHVEEFLARKHEKPFFLSFGVDEPHNDNISRPEIGVDGSNLQANRHSKTQYYDSEKLDSRYVAPAPNLPDHPEIRKEMASIARGVNIMDDYFGRALQALKHHGLEENTLVIITTDHGLEIPGGKKTLGDMGTGVMLLMRGGKELTGGKVIDKMVSHLDLFPTILAYLGQPMLPWLEGKNLLPLVKDPAIVHHEEIFTEQTYHGSLEAFRAVRTERYKLVLRFSPTGPHMSGPGRSQRFFKSLGWNDRALGHEELFDLYFDPNEACNRINDPDYAKIKTELREKLEAWMKKTKDPFLTGVFPERNTKLS